MTPTRKTLFRGHYSDRGVRVAWGDQRRSRLLQGIYGVPNDIPTTSVDKTCTINTQRSTHLERYGIWDPNRQVGDDRQHLVGLQALKCQVVGNFMDCEEQVMIGGATNDICKCNKFPGERVSMSE
jgi:hypothetical protein